MYIINGYQSKGVIEESDMPYDNLVLTCFADAWPEKIGLKDYDYFRFGQPTKIVKIPTSVVVACLNIPFNLGDDSREVVKRYDFEKIVGSELLPVYNDKGKVISMTISMLGASAPIELPPEAADQITIEDSNAAEQEKGKSKK